MKIFVRSILKPFIHPTYRFVQFNYGLFNRVFSSILALPPLVLRIRITNECDLACDYCYLKGHLNQIESNHLTLAEWKKIIAHLPRWTIIDITGAEPFRAKNFKEVLELFLERGFKISLITNGQTIDEDILDLIVRKKLFYLMVSIDGMEVTHNRARNNSEAFQKAKAFCLKLNEIKEKYKSNSPTLCIKTSLLETNQEDMNELQEMVFKELGADQQTLNLLFQNKARGGGILSEKWNSSALQEGNTQVYEKNIQDKIKSTVYILNQKARANKRTLQVKPPMKEEDWGHYISSPQSFGVKSCSKPFSIATMYYDGTLTPCDLAIKTGNVRELDYKISMLWKSSNFKNFYRDFSSTGMFKKACEGCALTQQCRK